MEVSNVAGVAWRLDYDDLGASGFKVHWTWCSSDKSRTARIRIPESWYFGLPPESGFTSEPFGASETRGLLGGVGSVRLERLSEQCERAIGDVLTYAVCQIVDKSDLRDGVRILVFGPALPKVVGRFCSLRLPDTVKIAWICPSPFPTWIAQRGDELQLVPLRHSSVGAADLEARANQSWDEEPLVMGFTWERDEHSYVVQYLCTGDEDLTHDPIDALGLNKLKGLEAQFAGGVWLPREIVASAGQAQIHSETPYEGVHEERFQLPPEDFASRELFEAGVHEQHNRVQEGIFTVEWGEKVA